jgi:hypothetical protein
MKKTLPYIIAILLAAFGLLTLFLSSSVIFDLFGIRAKEGNFVPDNIDTCFWHISFFYD